MTYTRDHTTARTNQTWIAVTIILILYVIPSALFPRSIPIYLLAGVMAAAVLFRAKATRGVDFGWLPLGVLLTALLRVLDFTLTAVLVSSHYYLSKIFRSAVSLRIARIFINLAGISLILQLIYFRFAEGNVGRSGLGTDVNFSGLRIFLFFILCRSLNVKIGWIVMLLGLVWTQSRLLLLFLVVYFIMKQILDISVKLGVKRFLRWFFPVIIIVLNVVIILFSAWILRNGDFSYVEAGSFVDRIINLNDQSNYGRALANVVWVENLLQGNYFFNTFDLETLDVSNGDLKPHNSLLYAALKDTIIYAAFALFSVWIVLLRSSTNRTVAFIYSYAVGGGFLHGLYSPVFLFELFFIAAVSENLMPESRKVRQHSLTSIDSPHISTEPAR